MDSFQEFFLSFQPSQNGFVFMWVLTGVALLAVAVTIERWWDIGRRTNVNAPAFMANLLRLVRENRLQDAYALCASGKRRALPRILGAGIKKSSISPALIRTAMEEESLHMIPVLEKRLNTLVTCGNLATLLGLMGTIYGLILSFAAVAQPDISPVEKTSMLATGISAAMNTTLMGLIIAVPCVLSFSFFRSRVDDTVAEIDRYAVTLLKVLVPQKAVQRSYKVSARRMKEEVETEPNMVPFMNLMVVLIPLLLSSSEFVKLGMVEIKLPESAQSSGGAGGGEDEQKKEAKLELGVVITKKGFSLFHHFKEDGESGERDTTAAEIPVTGGEYDYAALTRELAKVKKKALVEILGSVGVENTGSMSLAELYLQFTRIEDGELPTLKDHQMIKIVADEKTKYQTVIAVMDAARGVRTSRGKVTMFPDVSIAGGVI